MVGWREAGQHCMLSSPSGQTSLNHLRLKTSCFSKQTISFLDSLGYSAMIGDDVLKFLLHTLLLKRTLEIMQILSGNF